MKIKTSEISNFLSCSQRLKCWLQGERQIFSERAKRKIHDESLHKPAILNYALESLRLKEISRQVEGEKNVAGITLVAKADMLASTAAGEKVVVEAKLLKEKEIADVINNKNKSFDNLILANMLVFEAQKGFLVMRNKDTPANRFYEHSILEFKRNDDKVIHALEQIKKKAENKQAKERSSMCVFCAFLLACQTEAEDAEEFQELEELISEFKEMKELSEEIEAKKRVVRDEIVKLMRKKKVKFIKTRTGAAMLKSYYLIDLLDKESRFAAFKQVFSLRIT